MDMHKLTSKHNYKVADGLHRDNRHRDNLSNIGLLLFSLFLWTFPGYLRCINSRERGSFCLWTYTREGEVRYMLDAQEGGGVLLLLFKFFYLY